MRLIERAGTTLVVGPPNLDPAVSEEHVLLQWRIPESLRRLYAEHDGIGVFLGEHALWVERCILPADRLVPLSQLVRFGVDTIDYDPGALLLFAPDGRGGGQCFHRASPDDIDPPTVSWSADTYELGPPTSFAAFLAELLP